MNKEANVILKAYEQGSSDKRNGKPYSNPYNKNKDKVKHKAYKNGYNE